MKKILIDSIRWRMGGLKFLKKNIFSKWISQQYWDGWEGWGFKKN